MRHYIAVIHKDATTDYGASFPDIPGCITAGATLDEVRGNAEEALAFHVKGLVEDGDAVPEPSTLDSIMQDPECRQGVAVLIPLRLEPLKPVRVNVTIPADVLEQIDRYAADRGFNRSGFLTHAARRVMGSDAA